MTCDSGQRSKFGIFLGHGTSEHLGSDVRWMDKSPPPLLVMKADRILWNRQSSRSGTVGKYRRQKPSLSMYLRSWRTKYSIWSPDLTRAGDESVGSLLWPLGTVISETISISESMIMTSSLFRWQAHPNLWNWSRILKRVYCVTHELEMPMNEVWTKVWRESMKQPDMKPQTHSKHAQYLP